MPVTRAPFFSVPSVRYFFILLSGFFLTYLAFTALCYEKRYDVSFAPGMTLKSAAGEIVLEEIDFTPEPGEFPKYQEYNTFMARQSQITAILNSGRITVTRADTTTDVSAVKKELADLPALFWIQVIVALGALYISGWIWVLKPKTLTTQLFFLSGFGLAMSALTSAVYTSRALALPAEIFRPLSYANAIGAGIFACAMYALFLIYPHAIKHAKKWIVAGTFVFMGSVFGYCTQTLPEVLHLNLAIVIMMLGICGLIAVQYVITKHDPKARAILLWLGLSVVLGAGFFVAFNTLPLVLGTTPLEQGWAFLSFLIIYVGIALGIKQFRLFEVGDWAYGFLFYVAGTVIFVALDVALVFVLGIDRFPALGIALVFVGICYLPLRDFFWRIFSRKKELPSHELLGEALRVALAPTASQRLQRWESLLNRLFEPLEMKTHDHNCHDVEIENEGVVLILPPIADIPSLRLAYPWSGRALFSPRAVQTARQVVRFIEEAESSRQAYDRGVSEERMRIAQDLHDDVGARLLTGLHGENSDLRSTIQGAMTDIRTIIKGIAGERVPLSTLLADLRSESQKRLQAVGIDLDWQFNETENSDPTIDYRLHKTIGSAIREIVSNAIKHSLAKKLTVRISLNHEQIELSISDDGQGFSDNVLRGQFGFGLTGLHKRIKDLRGTLALKNQPNASVEIILPLT